MVGHVWVIDILRGLDADGRILNCRLGNDAVERSLNSSVSREIRACIHVHENELSVYTHVQNFLNRRVIKHFS
jgi:hypothetical protein